ncbi:MAG: hypothetical protein H8E17_02535 [Deltaproteobacteria bacterium]|nr:hypothetical protein [Deltaproteobacteria bacterium]
MITGITKSILLMISALLFLGCGAATNETNSSLSKKNEDNSPVRLKGGQKPPKELKLTSILYELAIASEPETFAKERGIFFIKDRVRIYIIFNPISPNSERVKLAEKYNIIVEKKADDLVRALVAIDRLIPLSKESIIWSIRLPDRPVKLKRKNYE